MARKDTLLGPFAPELTAALGPERSEGSWLCRIGLPAAAGDLSLAIRCLLGAASSYSPTGWRLVKNDPAPMPEAAYWLEALA